MPQAEGGMPSSKTGIVLRQTIFLIANRLVGWGTRCENLRLRDTTHRPT
jgi:hypothetical protein